MGWRSSALVVVVLGGCAFHPDGAADGGDGIVAADGRGADGADAATDGPAPPSCPPGYAADAAGAYYRLVEGPATWDDARADCADDTAGATYARHAHLVVLTDDVERDAVRAAFAGPRLWIGVSDRVVTFDWRWVTGEDTGIYPPASGPPWRDGQPTNGDMGAQDCVVMDENGRWDDRPCNSDENAYVCECDAFAEEPGNF